MVGEIIVGGSRQHGHIIPRDRALWDGTYGDLCPDVTITARRAQPWMMRAL
jgi:hypothetical protein